jgi:Fe2+ transport system protein FeoA
VNPGIYLAKAPLRTPLTLLGAEIESGAAQRLASLGLRVGSSFALIAKTAGGGRVALVAGSRVALGKSLLTQLRAEVTG